MLETVTYTQAIPPHMGGQGAVVTGDSEREREEEEDTSSSHPHHRRGELEAHAASAIQHPVVKHEQERKPEVMGVSGVLPPPSSFQSYQSSCETRQFSFQRLVLR